MSRARVQTPNDATVRLVTLFAAAWAALGLITQVIFTTVIAPSLGETFDFAIPGRGPTVAPPVDTTVMSVIGLVVTTIGLLVAVGTVLLARTNARSSYAFAAVVAIVIPGFVALVTGNGIAAVATGGDASTGASLLVTIVAIVVFCLSTVSVLGAPKFAAQRVGQA